MASPSARQAVLLRLQGMGLAYYKPSLIRGFKIYWRPALLGDKILSSQGPGLVPSSAASEVLPQTLPLSQLPSTNKGLFERAYPYI